MEKKKKKKKGQKWVQKKFFEGPYIYQHSIDWDFF